MARDRLGKGYAVYLACAAGLVAAVLPAASQEMDLRGAVRESDVNALLLGPDEFSDEEAGSTGIPAEPYQPASLGADVFLDSEELFGRSDALPGRARRSAGAGVPERQDESPAATAAVPALDGVNTATVRAVSVDAAEREALPLRLNQRATTIEGGARQSEEDPYAPLGLRVGTFVVVTELEQGLTSTTNADKSPGGDNAVLSETSLRLRAESDWPRHRATAEAYGTFRKSVSGEEVKELEGGAETRLELDLLDDLTARALLAYKAGREGASSPVAIPGVEEQPLRHTLHGSLGLERSLGRLRLGLTSEVQRDQYGDAELVGGGTLSQSDRDSTLVLARLRGGYEISPALTPFVEVEAGRRIYDNERDSAGYERSATRLGARAGVALDLSEKLRGELSAGWLSQDFEDSRLATISGPALAASLTWSPRRGTVVGLDALTEIEGSTDPGLSGSLLYSGTLRIERELRSNLTGEAALGASYRDYEAGGHDVILTGEAILTWWLNRYAGLTGRLRHERQTSSLPGRDYDATSLFMGLKLQR